MATKKERETIKYGKKIKKLVKKCGLENDKCADCGTTRPSWISTGIGVFLCMRCSCIHRNLFPNISRIKSLDLDSWNYESYKSFKSKGGNKKINKLYQSQSMGFNKTIKPNSQTDQFKLTQFIHLKYIEKKWYSTQNIKDTKQKKKKKKKKQESEEEEEEEDEYESDEESEDEIICKKIKLAPRSDEIAIKKNDDNFGDFEGAINIQSNKDNDDLLDLSQMEQAKGWRDTFVDNNDDEKNGNDIVHKIVNGIDINKGNTMNGKNGKSTNKILEKYKIKQNEVNTDLMRMKMMNMGYNQNMMMNMNMNMMNGMTPIQIQQQLQRMQMELHQMQIKLNIQNGNNINNIYHNNNNNNNNNGNNGDDDDNWADFGDLDNIDNTANNDDDNWANFEDGNTMNNNNNNNNNNISF